MWTIMPKMRIRWAAALVVLPALALSGCASATGQAGPAPCGSADSRLYPEGSSVDRIIRDGRLRVGVEYDSPGVGYRDPVTGEVTGFDVEIAKIVACGFGVPANGVDWVEAPARSREALITEDRVDMVIATYEITEARKKVVSFAGPYFRDYQTVMVRRGEKRITGPESTRGRRVCSSKGSVTLETIRKYGAIGVPAKDYFECVDLLLRGQVDAVSTLAAILIGQATLHPGRLDLVGQPFDDLAYGIGVRKTDSTMRRFLSDVLERSFTDGSWRAAYDRTLGRAGVGAPVPPVLHRY
jgi:glutamate transport system substrate-binding protein